MSKDTSMAEGTPETEETNDEVVVDDALSSDGETVDLTPPLDPEDFDFNAFVEGVRPGRRGVLLTMRPDLVGEIDKIVSDFEGGRSTRTTDENKVLLDRYKAVKAELVASQRWFVVEARSASREDEIKEQMRKQGRRYPGNKAPEALRVEWHEEVALRRLADAIITPSNVTYEGLKRMYAQSESQVNLLLGAMESANTDPTRGITPDFSRGL